MSHLVRFELKRMICNRFVWLLIILFMMADIYKIYAIENGLNNPTPGGEKIYEEIKGNVTNEKAQFLISRYEELTQIVSAGNYSTSGNQEGTYTGYIYGDYSEFGTYYERYKYIYDYTERMDGVVTTARGNIENLENSSKFQIRKNKKIVSDYSNRKIQQFYNMEHMQLYLEYDFSTIFIFLLVIAAASGILYYDRKGKVLYLVKTSSMGLRRSMISKMLAIGIYACMVTVFVAIVDFAVFSFFFQLEGWNQPLYAISDYADTAVNMTVLECVFFQMLMRMIGAFFWGLTVFVISKKSKKNSWTIVSVIGLFAGSVWLCLNEKLFLNPVGLFAPIQLIKDFDVVNVAGFPVYYFQEVIVVVIFMIILLFFLGCYKAPDVD